MKNRTTRPLRVFISSVMENKDEPDRKNILDIRSKLYNKLNSYSFIEPFILEKDSPSVLDLKTTYITPLRQSNLVVFLLDSHKPISEGVQFEITESRNANIPRIYFIIPGKTGDADVMKEMLIQQGEINYIMPLQISNNYAKIIENDIFQQLIRVFQAYFNQKNLTESESGDNSTLPNTASTILTSAQFQKEMFNQVSFSKQAVQKLIFHEDSDHPLAKPESPLDESIYNLIQRLTENKPLPCYWNKNMLDAIVEANSKFPLPNEFIIVLTQRLKAVSFFFSEKYKEAAECLKRVLKLPEIQELPSWILQDTLIDLRNLLAIDDELKNQWQLKNQYQIELDKTLTPFYYPGIDRSLKVVNEWVQLENNKFSTSSSDEESIYGSGINQYSDAITDAEIFAACNGSITQIRQFNHNLNILSEMFLKRFENKVYLKDVIQNQLLMGKSYKKISRWINRYSFLQGQFLDSDAMNILNTIESHPVKIEKLTVKATAMRIVGDYLTDEHFTEKWTELFDEIQTWLNKSELILHPANEILGLFRYCFRIPQDDIVRLIIILSSRAPRYYDEIADIISGAIDYDSTTVENRITLSTALLTIVKSTSTNVLTQKIENALLSVIELWPDETSELRRYLEQKQKEYFEKNIRPCLWKSSADAEFSIYIKNQINFMKSQNEQQSGGVVSFFGVDPFLNIYNALSHGYNVENTSLIIILQKIVETLNNPHQTIDSKKSALKLMMCIMYNDKIQNSDSLTNIDSRNLSAEASGFFEVETPTKYIEALRAFIRLILSHNDEGQMLTILTLDQSSKYLNFVTEMLIDFLPITAGTNSLSNTIPQIIQFLITNNNSHERENKLIINISKCFIVLANYQQYTNIALGQLQRLVSDTNNIVQRNLVVQINRLPANRQRLFDSIKIQLMANSSFSVRDLAIRDFKSLLSK